MEYEEIVEILRGLTAAGSDFAERAARLMKKLEAGARFAAPDSDEERLPGTHFARIYETRALLPNIDEELRREAQLLASFFARRRAHQFALVSILDDDLQGGALYVGDHGEHAAG